MLAHLDGNKAVTQHADARDQQSDQVHDVLPLHLALVADVGLHLLELRHDVAVVGLVHEPGEEERPHGEQFLGQRRGLLHQRRVETLQHVRIRLQSQYQELLDFPVCLLRLFAFELFGDAVERPVQFGRRQIEYHDGRCPTHYRPARTPANR